MNSLLVPSPEICTSIHFGEVGRSSEGVIFGDAVNIASRIQGIAVPGQIVLSAAIEEWLRGGQSDPVSPGQREL